MFLLFIDLIALSMTDVDRKMVSSITCQAFFESACYFPTVCEDNFPDCSVKQSGASG